MLGKRAEVKRIYKGIERFPDFPPRGDPLNILYLYHPSYIYALEVYMGDPETTIVMGEVPVGRTPGQSAGIRIVDFLIADNVDRALIIEQMGYAIELHGKPPDFALDIAPLKAEDADYTEKRSAESWKRRRKGFAPKPSGTANPRRESWLKWSGSARRFFVERLKRGCILLDPSAAHRLA